MRRIIVLTGPSGVGKTTVAQRLMARLPRLKKLVTCTTRTPRDGEVAGVDYHFFSKKEFKAMIARNELFEWANVYDHFYGNRTADVEKIVQEGFDVLMVIDVQGARTVKKTWPNAFTIFLVPKSEMELRERIAGRGNIEQEELQRRLQAAREEMTFAKEANAVIRNPQGKLDETVEALYTLLTK